MVYIYKYLNRINIYNKIWKKAESEYSSNLFIDKNIIINTIIITTITKKTHTFTSSDLKKIKTKTNMQR